MNILFLSRESGGRIQMAAGLARQMFGSDVTATIASVEGGNLHPLAVACMSEINIDIAGQTVLRVDQIDVGTLDLVVVVSERDVAEGVVPRTVKRLHWPIMDPADPPAPEPELKKRFLDVRTALSKHLKGLGKLKKKL